MVRSMLVALPPVPSDCYGSRASACLGILIAVPIFFFLYDAVAHRNQPLPIVGSTTLVLSRQRSVQSQENLSNVAHGNADASRSSVSRLPSAKSETALNRSVAAKNIKTRRQVKEATCSSRQRAGVILKVEQLTLRRLRLTFRRGADPSLISYGCQATVFV